MNHGLRAVRAALGLANAIRRIDAYTRKNMTGRGLSPFALGIALHSGPVAFARLDGLISRTGQTAPVGDTVATALKLHQGEPHLAWLVVASAQNARLVTGAVRIGQRALVQVSGCSNLWTHWKLLDWLEPHAKSRPLLFRCALC